MNVDVKGRLVKLRDLTHDDITERYLSWFRDGTVTQFLSARNLRRSDVIAYMDEGRQSGTYHMLAVCDAATGLHIGNVKIGPIDRTHGTSNLVTVIGDRTYWGRGFATEAIALASYLAFDRFGVRKLCDSIIGGNLGSVKSYTRAGWHIECTRRSQFLVDGVPQDEIFIACFSSQSTPSAP